MGQGKSQEELLREKIKRYARPLVGPPDREGFDVFLREQQKALPIVHSEYVQVRLGRNLDPRDSFNDTYKLELVGALGRHKYLPALRDIAFSLLTGPRFYGEDRIKQAEVHALGLMGDPSAIDDITQSSDNDASLTKAAIKALVAIGTDRAFEAIQAIVRRCPSSGTLAEHALPRNRREALETFPFVWSLVRQRIPVVDYKETVRVRDELFGTQQCTAANLPEILDALDVSSWNEIESLFLAETDHDGFVHPYMMRGALDVLIDAFCSRPRQSQEKRYPTITSHWLRKNEPSPDWISKESIPSLDSGLNINVHYENSFTQYTLFRAEENSFVIWGPLDFHRHCEAFSFFSWEISLPLAHRCSLKEDLLALKPEIEDRLDVSLTQELLVELAEATVSDETPLPVLDWAIVVLERALRISIETSRDKGQSPTRKISKVEQEISVLREEQATYERVADWERAMEIRHGRLPELEKRLTELSAEQLACNWHIDRRPDVYRLPISEARSHLLSAGLVSILDENVLPVRWCDVCGVSIPYGHGLYVDKRLSHTHKRTAERMREEQRMMDESLRDRGVPVSPTVWIERPAMLTCDEERWYCVSTKSESDSTEEATRRWWRRTRAEKGKMLREEFATSQLADCDIADLVESCVPRVPHGDSYSFANNVFNSSSVYEYVPERPFFLFYVYPESELTLPWLCCDFIKKCFPHILRAKVSVRPAYKPFPSLETGEAAREYGIELATRQSIEVWKAEYGISREDRFECGFSERGRSQMFAFIFDH